MKDKRVVYTLLVQMINVLMKYFFRRKVLASFAYFQGAKDRINFVDSLKRVDKHIVSLGKKSLLTIKQNYSYTLRLSNNFKYDFTSIHLS